MVAKALNAKAIVTAGTLENNDNNEGKNAMKAKQQKSFIGYDPFRLESLPQDDEDNVEMMMVRKRRRRRRMMIIRA